jgi:hypothetical protein
MAGTANYFLIPSFRKKDLAAVQTLANMSSRRDAAAISSFFE